MSQGKGNTIDKTLDILMVFLPHNEELGTTEISRRLGLHKATVSRILLNLNAKGFLQKNPSTKKYMLGEAVLQLGNAASRSFRSNLLPIAKPVIDALRDELKETVTMESLVGSHTIMAYVADGPHPIRVAAAVGEILPNHAAAGAKAILACSPHDVRCRCVNGTLQVFTDKTIRMVDEFQEQLGVINRQGYSTDLGEIEDGVNAIGVPIFNNEGLPVAAVSVVGPASRIPGDRLEALVALLLETASEISSRLHYRGVFFVDRLMKKG